MRPPESSSSLFGQFDARTNTSFPTEPESQDCTALLRLGRSVPPQEFYGFAQSEFVAATQHTAGTAEDIMRVWKLLLDTVTPFAGRTPLRFRPRSFEHEFIEHTTRAAGSASPNSPFAL
jgi:hypothetical protein